jgi:hypothetical protein
MMQTIRSDEVSRTLRAFYPATGDTDGLQHAFTGDPQRWLPSPRHEGAQHWRIPVHAGAFTRHVRLTLGKPWRGGSTTWRTMQWDPVPEAGDASTIDRLLPSFDGELGLYRHRRTEFTLVLDGRYTPPGGPLGTAIDVVALNRVARTTIDRFLADVAAGLAAEATLSGAGERNLPNKVGARRASA